MAEELFKVFLGFLGVLLSFLFGYLFAKIPKWLKTAIYIGEKFIEQNQELLELPWEKAKKQIENFIEKPVKIKIGSRVYDFKIDLTDEQWEKVWAILKEKFLKAQKESGV